jgi:predicted nucleotidyltransferase component of viral defense system
LARITVKYTNSFGTNDNFKLEIGYMRRIPVLKNESTEEFKHIGTQETFPIKTPIKEELFANKWCTLLYRGTPRDLFDVYQISKNKIDLETFRKCSIIDSLMRGKTKLHKINIEKTLESINLDSNLRNVLQTEQLSKLDINEMKEKVKEFSQKTMETLTQNEIKAIDRFYQLKQFEPNLIDEKGIFHPKIKDHPAIQRTPKTVHKEKTRLNDFKKRGGVW